MFTSQRLVDKVHRIILLITLHHIGGVVQHQKRDVTAASTCDEMRNDENRMSEMNSASVIVRYSQRLSVFICRHNYEHDPSRFFSYFVDDFLRASVDRFKRRKQFPQRMSWIGSSLLRKLRNLAMFWSTPCCSRSMIQYEIDKISRNEDNCRLETWKRGIAEGFDMRCRMKK